MDAYMIKSSTNELRFGVQCKNCYEPITPDRARRCSFDMSFEYHCRRCGQVTRVPNGPHEVLYAYQGTNHPMNRRRLEPETREEKEPEPQPLKGRKLDELIAYFYSRK